MPATVTPERTASATRERPALRFMLGFAVWIGIFSLLFQWTWFEKRALEPITAAVARASGVVLRALGFDTAVTGTVIAGAEGFSVNILHGCDGAYVTAIFLAAVLAFPSSLREKTIGVLAGIPAVQAINIVRIVSLYYLGVRHPALFETFHYHVWQTVVILLSLSLWLVWAEVLVKKPAR